MSGSPWILFQLAQPQIGCYSTRLTFQTMSEPFQIFFKSEQVGIGYIHSLYVLNNAWMGLNFIAIGKTPNRSLFNPTGIPDNVRTIPNNPQKSESDNINPFIYYTMCRRARTLFYCKLLRIGIYSIQLTPQVMSEPFQIWFRHVRNNLSAGTAKTLHCMPDSAYRHSVELHRMVQNGYSVSIQW